MREVDLNGKLLDGINSDGLQRMNLATESGRSIILDVQTQTEQMVQVNYYLKMKLKGDVVLDGTDLDSTDAGDNIINESPIDFSNKNVTITD